MGLTIVHKSNLSTRKRSPRIALVLAGGAVTSGAYELGGDRPNPAELRRPRNPQADAHGTRASGRRRLDGNRRGDPSRVRSERSRRPGVMSERVCAATFCVRLALRRLRCGEGSLEVRL